MFRYFAKNITNILIKNKKLNIENKEIYEYAMEAILMNSILLIVFLGISIIGEKTDFYMGFLLFFVPMRTFAGGYHAKKSETCFILSTVSYTVAMHVCKWLENSYNYVIIICVYVIAILSFLLWSPLNNINHPMAEYQYKRNKKIVYSLVILYSLCFVLFTVVKCRLAICEVVFVALAAIFLMAGRLRCR